MARECCAAGSHISKEVKMKIKYLCLWWEKLHNWDPSLQHLLRQANAVHLGISAVAAQELKVNQLLWVYPESMEVSVSERRALQSKYYTFWNNERIYNNKIGELFGSG